MKFYSAEDIANSLDFPMLIDGLRKGFTKEYDVPPRVHINFDNPTDNNENTMLLMPAIRCGDVAGVKVVAVTPDNAKRNLPSIQGIYYLLDAVTGVPLALVEAKALTNWRTAAASALASKYLSREDSSIHLMIGTGSLAPFLIDAHRAIRPIKELLIYGRNEAKAIAMVKEKSQFYDKVNVITNLDEAVQYADIISVATMSKTPLIQGEWLKPGQHVDLVGAYRTDMREADDQVLTRSNVFVDNMLMAPKETGDLAIPISQGVISEKDLKGDLFQLCKGEIDGRKSASEITVFKSVGHALEDLVAAELILQKQEVNG